MDIFAQKKLLIRTVIVLVLLNIVVLGVFIRGNIMHHRPPGSPPGEGFNDLSGVLEKELNLNADQVLHLKKVRNDFLEKEKLVLNTLHEERNSMNAVMFNKNTDDALLNILAKSVSENEFKMELLRIEQAKALKAICTPEQLDKFESLVVEIRDYFRPDNQLGRRR